MLRFARNDGVLLQEEHFTHGRHGAVRRDRVAGDAERLDDPPLGAGKPLMDVLACDRTRGKIDIRNPPRMLWEDVLRQSVKLEGERKVPKPGVPHRLQANEDPAELLKLPHA